MEKFTTVDMAYIYKILSEIKKPSPKIKRMMFKLENQMHTTIMGMFLMKPDREI